MLVLSRKLNQSIVIGEQVEVVVLEIKGDVVKLGVKAPREVSVYRQEVFVEIQAENTRAAGADRKAAKVSDAGALLKQALGKAPFKGAPGSGFGRPASGTTEGGTVPARGPDESPAEGEAPPRT